MTIAMETWQPDDFSNTKYGVTIVRICLSTNVNTEIGNCMLKHKRGSIHNCHN
jgi:hypothetical protein